MEEYLRKLKIIDSFTLELNTSRSEFMDKLSAIIEEGDIGFFSSSFDIFSSSTKQYKGQIDYHGFKIKKKRKFFDGNMSMAVATGTIRQQNDHIIIETEINGFYNFFIFYYIFLTVIYTIFIFGVGGSDESIPMFVTPFVILHAALMFFIPYFIMRRSVRNLKYELEREFFYLTKK